MGQPVMIRGNYTSGELRRLATQCQAAGQARRLLAIAAVVDGASRMDAARIGGMDRRRCAIGCIGSTAKGPTA